MTQQLVVVDDSEVNREAVLGYAALLGWLAFGSDGSTHPVGLDAGQPILVLLDFVLDGIKPGNWLNDFLAAYPEARVYLLTGHESDCKSEIAAFRKKHLIAGVLSKPFDLTRLPTLAEELLAPVSSPRPREKRSLLEQAADQMEPAIRLLKKDTLELLWANARGKESSASAPDRMVQRMAEELEADPEATRVYRTDWDPAKQRFLRRRLYRAGLDWYWLAEDWKSEAEDAEFLHLFLPKDWRKQFEVLADIFSQHWGITRMRFYRVARLAGEESGEGCYLLRPMWQMGDGFRGDEAGWLADEFLFRDNAHVLRVFADPGSPWSLSPVNDGDLSSQHGCDQIVWGNAGTRAEIPIWQDDQPIALLALDRRSDHLKREDSPWAEDEKQGPLDASDMASMEGYLAATEPFLLDKVLDYQKERRAFWRDKLDALVQEAMGGSDARDALGKVFDGLRAAWDAKGAPLSDLLLLRQQTGGLYTLWAGSGARWEALGASSRVYEAADFLQEVPAPYRVIQNLAGCWKTLASADQQALSPLLTAGGTPSGAMLLLPLLEGTHLEGLLLVFTPTANHLTEPRVAALHQASQAIHGLLRWGLAQAERDWLSRALAHEFRKPTHLLRHAFRQLPDAARPQAEGALRILEASIQNLRYLAHPDVIATEPFEDIGLTEIMGEVAGCLAAIYPERIRPLPDLPWQIHSPRTVLFQVLYNLLDNACKYSDGPQAVWLEVQEVAEILNLTIFNHATAPIAAADMERIWLPYVRVERTETATGAGIGLAALRQLCQGTGLSCVLSHPGTPEQPVIGFSIELPISQVGGQP